MNIAVIGGGFTGLSAAYFLTKEGHRVDIFEKDERPGGLAIGYKEPEWKWTLEEHYHHWFTNDKSVLDLAAEIGHKVEIRRPKTSTFVDGGIYQLDSPISLLKFPKLNILNRIRMGASLAFLRFNPYWHPLENFRAEPYLKTTMGKKGYALIWEPLMKNKLGRYAQDVSLAWFWARVYKRTPSLAYPEGGFLNFAKHLEEKIKTQGGKFYYSTEVNKVTSNNKVSIEFKVSGHKSQGKNYDAVIVTLPSFLFLKIAENLPQSYMSGAGKLTGIGATNLVVRLKKPFFKDGTYWLNMSHPDSDILAVVEHTNFMDSRNYNNEHILYLGNYMPPSDPKFSMSEAELLKLYDPWLKKINPGYKSNIISYKLFRAPFAQPIITPKYSKKVPKFITPLKNVFLANIEQVYPWDRGTNYAVELGKKVSKLI
jgi:protoporphyrinogen oxidase